MKNSSDFPEWTEGAKTQCPSCDGHQVTTTVEEQRFTYGTGDDAVELKAQVPVHHCADCDIDFTDGFAPVPPASKGLAAPVIVLYEREMPESCLFKAVRLAAGAGADFDGGVARLAVCA